MSTIKKSPLKSIIVFMTIVCITVLAVIFVGPTVKGILPVEVSAQDMKQAMSQTDEATVKAAAAKATAKTQLQSIIDPFSLKYGSTVGAVVTDLSTGATVSVNSDQSFVSASLYKLFVAYDVYLKIDQGTVSYDQSVGSLASNNSVAGCLNLMITISDNDCGVALGELDGWTSLDQLLQNEGYTHTILNNYDAKGTLIKDKVTTASDVALLLQRLYSGTLLSASSSQNFLTLLKADEINTYLPSGLPAGTVIAHKIGYLYGYVHDAGIIYGTNKNVLVVLLTGEWDDPATDAPPVFAELSSALWLWMGQ